jgi:hypothetical protein
MRKRSFVKAFADGDNDNNVGCILETVLLPKHNDIIQSIVKHSMESIHIFLIPSARVTFSFVNFVRKVVSAYVDVIELRLQLYITSTSRRLCLSINYLEFEKSQKYSKSGDTNHSCNKTVEYSLSRPDDFIASTVPRELQEQMIDGVHTRLRDICRVFAVQIDVTDTPYSMIYQKSHQNIILRFSLRSTDTGLPLSSFNQRLVTSTSWIESVKDELFVVSIVNCRSV